MPRSTKQLSEESKRANQLLASKIVARVTRHRHSEVLVEFTGGTRLFVESSEDGVELSITGTEET